MTTGTAGTTGTAATAPTAAVPEERTFLGHPPGLAYLSFTEAWERFSYYGMIGLLILYLTDQLLTPGHVEQVLGFASFRAGIEAVFGPLTSVALASQIVGLYTGLIYVTPILGGLLADRALGQRRTVIAGAIMMAAGHLLMAFEALLLPALGLLVIGAGCIKGNMAAQVGRLYAPADPRRTRAFAIYLIALNVGAFMAPLVCGTLGERYGWHYGFGAAGIGMLIALGVYVAGRRHLPPDSVRTRRDGLAEPERLHPGDGRRLAALLVLLVPYVLFFSAYNQAFNLFVLWARDHVDRRIFGIEMPVTWFFTLDGVLTVVGTAAVVRLWRAQATRGREPGDLAKIAIGCGLCAAAFLVLAAAAAGSDPAGLAPTVGFFVLVDFAIPFVDTVTLALFSRAAPAALSTTMIGIYYLAFAAANIAVGWLGQFYEMASPSAFWLLHAGIGAAGLAFVAVVGRPLGRALRA